MSGFSTNHEVARMQMFHALYLFAAIILLYIYC